MKIRFQWSVARYAKAFTLAEVVIATMIVTVSATALMGCFNLSFFIMQMARENQRATQVILEKAEAIRLCNWDQVNTSGFIPATFTDYYDPTATNGSKGAVYNGTCAVSAFPDGSVSYATNMRTLTIIVRWNTKSVARARTNITLIVKDGIQNYVY